MVDFMEGGQGMGAKGFQCLEMRDIDWVMGKNCSELTACDGRKSSFEGGGGRGVWVGFLRLFWYLVSGIGINIIHPSLAVVLLGGLGNLDCCNVSEMMSMS